MKQFQDPYDGLYNPVFLLHFRSLARYHHEKLADVSPGNAVWTAMLVRRKTMLQLNRGGPVVQRNPFSIIVHTLLHLDTVVHLRPG